MPLHDVATLTETFWRAVLKMFVKRDRRLHHRAQDIHFTAARVIFEGLKELGIFKGDTDEALEAGTSEAGDGCGDRGTEELGNRGSEN